MPLSLTLDLWLDVLSSTNIELPEIMQRLAVLLISYLACAGPRRRMADPPELHWPRGQGKILGCRALYADQEG